MNELKQTIYFVFIVCVFVFLWFFFFLGGGGGCFFLGGGEGHSPFPFWLPVVVVPGTKREEKMKTSRCFNVVRP